jgi:hypothetical protein
MVSLPPLRIGGFRPQLIGPFARPSHRLFVLFKQSLYLIHFALLPALHGDAKGVYAKLRREDAHGLVLEALRQRGGGFL